MPRAPRPLVEPGGRVASTMVGVFLALLGLVPERVLLWLGARVGDLAYLLRIRRRVTVDNLRHAFPDRAERDRRSIARAAYRNLGVSVVEALTSNRLTDAELEARVDVENWEPVAQALRAGKGVLAATAHFGSWELFGEVMARRGVPIHAVVRPLSGALNERLVKNRTHAGMRLILQRGALSKMLRAVREGALVAQLIDQVLPSKSAVFVPFFGRLAATSPALSVAAARTQAPVFVIVAPRVGRQLRIIVEGPVVLERSGDLRRDVEAHTARLTAIVERHVRQYPEQWFWLHRRWKVAPPEAALQAHAQADARLEGGSRDADRGREPA